MSSISTKIRSLSRSDSAKKVGKNLFYLSLLQFGGYIFPLITMPYLARVIGVYGFGKIAFAGAILTYAQTLTDWGFDYTTTRDIARAKDDFNKIEKIYSNVTLARILLMLISISLIALLTFTIPNLRENAPIIMISLILLPGHVLFPEWLFQGLQEMSYITYLNFISKLLFTVLIFVFIKAPQDYLLQPLLFACGYIMSAIISIFYIWHKWRIRLRFYTFNEIITSIKDSTDVFINTLMPNFYNSFSIILLGFFGGVNSNGYYDGGNRFNNVCYKFLQVISRAFFPFLATRLDKHALYAKLSIVLSVIISIISFIFAPTIISFFLTNAFDESIIVLQIMSISIIFLTVSNVYGTNYLILLNKERQLRNATIIASIIGLVISIPLVYYFDYIGAAVTICLTRGILALAIWLAARKAKQTIV